MKILITHYSPLNSYCSQLGDAYSKRGHQVYYNATNFYFSNIIPDILHIQWPESLYKWQININSLPHGKESLIQRLEWYKNKGTKIIHTIHNIEPHEIEHSWETEIYETILEHSDLLIHHGSNSIALLNEKYKISSKKKAIVAPHGHYLKDYKHINQDEARKKLGLPLNVFIILNFGIQRAYKNNDFLQNVFNMLTIENKFLVNAGHKQIQKNHFIKRIFSALKAINKNNNIKDFNYYIPHSEISLFFNAANIVFLGHSKGLNSGILAMAATYSKPVIFPDIGNFKEQVAGWISESYDVNNILSAVKAVEKIALKMQSNKMPDNTFWVKNNSWENHVKIILDNI